MAVRIVHRMPRSANSGPPDGSEPPSISGTDTARYTKDLLENLKRMAVAQDQLVLAHLLDVAGREADRLIRRT